VSIHFGKVTIMKTIYSQVCVAAAMLLLIATGSSAQDRSALLTSIEVKQLTAGAHPDHVRLREHFTALADIYAKNAERHDAMAHTLPGNPNHPPAMSAGDYHRQLAGRARETATTVRQLVAYHDQLAKGVRAVMPSAGAPFERGEGSPSPSESHVRELVASARTAADHRALEEYFSEHAAWYLDDAREHAALAQSYRVRPNDRTGSFAALASHCEQQAERSRKAADDAQAAASQQRQLETA
jgi:hypothetical protein